MFLPIGDDNPNERTPVVHYGILGLNVLVFLYMMVLPAKGVEDFFARWALVPARPTLVTLFTSLYVHAGVYGPHPSYLRWVSLHRWSFRA